MAWKKLGQVRLSHIQYDELLKLSHALVLVYLALGRLEWKQEFSGAVEGATGIGEGRIYWDWGREDLLGLGKERSTRIREGKTYSIPSIYASGST